MQLPKLGSYSDISHLSGALYDLTVTLRNCMTILRDCGMSVRAIAAEIHQTKSVVSALINGERKRPDLGVLISLHNLASRYAARSKQSLPHIGLLTSQHQQVILEAAHARPCRSCGRPWEPAPIAASAERMAADGPATTASVPPGGMDMQLPVSPALGDRQAHWNDFTDLAKRLSADQFADAAGILRHIGQDAGPAEAAAAIAVCSQEGLADAAEAIATYAARRADEEILFMLRALLGNGNAAAAAELVTLRLER